MSRYATFITIADVIAALRAIDAAPCLAIERYATMRALCDAPLMRVACFYFAAPFHYFRHLRHWQIIITFVISPLFSLTIADC